MPKMSEASNAARTLKRLREQAGISMPEAAEATGYKGRISSYQHYEDRTKKETLPIDLIRGMATLFSSRGLDTGPLWPLAGIKSSLESDDLPPPSTEEVNDSSHLGNNTVPAEREDMDMHRRTELLSIWTKLDRLGKDSVLNAARGQLALLQIEARKAQKPFFEKRQS